MKVEKAINPNLGLNLNYWNGINKNERVFLAKEIIKQLGYSGGNDTLRNLELTEGVDKVTLRKKDYPDFFKQLTEMNSIGSRTGTVIMLYESGVWKLIMQSRKKIGIQTRNWLAREVLPSINAKGYYDVSESILNPLSYLNGFTENKKQIQNSKEVARKAKLDKLNYSDTYNQIHKMVVGMTASEIKTFFKSKTSARETLRLHLPEMASTEAVIDELFSKHNKSLQEIEKSKANKTLPPAFKSLYDLGIKPIM